MNRDALLALVRVEMERAVAGVWRTVLFGVGAAAFLWLAGWATRPRLGFLIVTISIAFAWHVPMHILRDKLDGGVEFLVSLPLSAGTLALGKLLPVALLSAIAALGLAASAVLAWPEILADVPGGLPNAVMGIWLVLTLGSGVLAGAMLRIRPNRMGALMIGGMVLLVALDELVPRIPEPPMAFLRTMLARPEAPLVLWLLGVVLVLATAFLSFYLARTGFERFTPDRDRVN